jgi:hypothetical protein
VLSVDHLPKCRAPQVVVKQQIVASYWSRWRAGFTAVELIFELLARSAAGGGMLKSRASRFCN